MRHLVRLVTPSGGTVLDPFLGSGSTAIAAELEGFPWIGIEQSAEYVAIAEARLNGTQRGLGLDTEFVQPPRKTIGQQVGHEYDARRKAPKGWGGGPWATDSQPEEARESTEGRNLGASPVAADDGSPRLSFDAEPVA